MRTPNKRSVTFTNSNLASYDSYRSSLGFRWYNDLGVLDIAPINAEFIGKTPKKGDQVYDYEAKVSLYLNTKGAKAVLNAIKYLRTLLEDGNTDKVKKLSVDVGYHKTVTFILPGMQTLKIKGKAVDIGESIILQVNIPDAEDKDEIINALHILPTDELLVDGEDGDASIIMHTGLDLLEEFLTDVVRVGVAGYEHAAKKANGGNGGGTKRSKAFSNYDEDDEDDDSESTKKSSKAKKKISTSDLEDEFDEDE